MITVLLFGCPVWADHQLVANKSILFSAFIPPERVSSRRVLKRFNICGILFYVKLYIIKLEIV
jgi:hypothetical protein